MSDEAHLPAEQPRPQAASRVPQPHGDGRRPQGSERSPRPRPQKAQRLVILRKRSDFLAANRGTRIPTPGFVLLVRNRDDGDDALRVGDVVWIGNWGDDERAAELEEFLIQPALALPEMHIVVHGVRYPDLALQKLVSANIEYRGYLPNLFSPQVYAESMVSVHIPRREYANGLAGIPTIRVFEVLACGIPLVCSPWMDQENLFRPGQDYLVVQDGVEMTEELRHLRRDGKARYQLAENGLQTIRERHTCAHRAQQLMQICEEIAR